MSVQSVYLWNPSWNSCNNSIRIRHETSSTLRFETVIHFTKLTHFSFLFRPAVALRHSGWRSRDQERENESGSRRQIATCRFQTRSFRHAHSEQRRRTLVGLRKFIRTWERDELFVCLRVLGRQKRSALVSLVDTHRTLLELKSHSLNDIITLHLYPTIGHCSTFWCPDFWEMKNNSTLNLVKR